MGRSLLTYSDDITTGCYSMRIYELQWYPRASTSVFRPFLWIDLSCCVTRPSAQ